MRCATREVRLRAPTDLMTHRFTILEHTLAALGVINSEFYRQWAENKHFRHGLGPEGRRFESSRPDHGLSPFGLDEFYTRP